MVPWQRMKPLAAAMATQRWQHWSRRPRCRWSGRSGEVDGPVSAARWRHGMQAARSARQATAVATTTRARRSTSRCSHRSCSRCRPRSVRTATTCSAATRMIRCVQDTAIRTDRPGLIGCPIAQDVWSDDGTTLLVRKGARRRASSAMRCCRGRADRRDLGRDRRRRRADSARTRPRPTRSAQPAFRPTSTSTSGCASRAR